LVEEVKNPFKDNGMAKTAAIIDLCLVPMLCVETRRPIYHLDFERYTDEK